MKGERRVEEGKRRKEGEREKERERERERESERERERERDFDSIPLHTVLFLSLHFVDFRVHDLRNMKIKIMRNLC